MKYLLPILTISLASCAPSLSGQALSDLQEAHLKIHEYAAQQGKDADNSLNIGLAKLSVVAAGLSGDRAGAQAAIMRQFAYLLNCDNPGQTPEEFAQTLSRQLSVAARMQQIANGTPTLKRGQELAQNWNEHEYNVSAADFTNCEDLIAAIHQKARK